MVAGAPQMAEECCGLCRFVRYENHPTGRRLYERRRHPPQQGNHGAVWPSVERHDWCGEFQPGLHDVAKDSTGA